MRYLGFASFNLLEAFATVGTIGNLDYRAPNGFSDLLEIVILFEVLL